MIIKIIKTEEDYRKVLARMEELFDAPIGSQPGDEADILALLIEDYEKRYYPIDSPDPIEAIKIRMEELNLRQLDLVDVFGGKNRASEILNRKRRLTLEMIRNLAARLSLPVSVLINDYQLR